MSQRAIVLTLTDVGRAALVNAAQQRLDIQFTGIALGSGTATLTNASTGLTSQQENQPIFTASEPAPGQLRISASFAQDPAQQYAVTELAIMAGNVVFAVWSVNSPTQALVVRTPGVPYTASVIVATAALPSQNISIAIQPLDAALQQEIADAFAARVPQTWNGSGARPVPRFIGDWLLDMSQGGPYGVPLLGVSVNPPAWIQMSGVVQQ